uniref:Large ribosomal subunit protein mL43 n=1 Tax=Schistosoma haematobium TaxID=6185 RepID=A0A095A461_SCHHA
MSEGVLYEFLLHFLTIQEKYRNFHTTSETEGDYIENHLVDFARDNPATVIYVKPRRNRPPLLVAEYLCGNWQYVRAKDMTCEEIANWINFLRTRSGVNIFPMYKYWSTKRPSIQGMWHPFYEPLYNQTVLKTPNEIVRNIGQLCQNKQNVLSAEEVLLEKAKLQQYRLSDLSS